MNAALELDDLKQTLRTLDRKLERQHTLNREIFKQGRVKQMQSGLGGLRFGQVLQLIAGGALSLVSANFWVAHLHVPHLLLCGALLHLYGISMVVFAAYDLVLIAGIDYAAPVLEIQRKLAALRRWHLRASIWFTVSGCCMWTPLTLMAFYALGADLWLNAPAVVWSFIASNFACLGVAWGLVRRSRRPGMVRLARLVERSAVGSALLRAEAVLDEIERFGQE